VTNAAVPGFVRLRAFPRLRWDLTNPRRVSESVQRSLLWVSLIVGFLVGCSDVAGPGAGDVHGLQLLLTIAPDTVLAGEEFEARLSIVNTAADTVVPVAANSCAAMVGVYKDDKRQDGSNVFKGTDYGCLTVPMAWPIAGRDSLIMLWQVPAGTGEYLPESGEYTFRVDFEVSPELPSLERLFWVR